MKKIFFLLILLIPIFSFTVEKNKVCLPEIIKNNNAIEKNLKICDPGNRVLIKYDSRLSPEYLIAKICDLRFTVIYDLNKEIINTRNKSAQISCIFLPDSN